MDLFETIIDRLEKESFYEQAQRERALASLNLLREEDVVCCVCLNGDSEDANQIVFCDGCNMAVHQSCYGVETIPEVLRHGSLRPLC